jgi:hypothetical protein
MHSAERVSSTATQQSDAAKTRWLKLNPDERRDATEAAREARRQKYRDQLPAGLEPDEVERRVDELIAIHMRQVTRRRLTMLRKAKELAAEADRLADAIPVDPAGAA